MAVTVSRFDYPGGVLLESVRVLDLADARADAVARLLADLGADVIKLEPPGGCPSRTDPPLLAGTSIPFGLHNANKRSVVLDPDMAADRRRFIDLAATADIVVDSGLPGRAADYGTSCAALADRFGHLVTMSVTDFGADGPRSSWQATDPVLYALSGALSRSGPPAGTPVLPPDGIASATAAVQAAWAVLIAYYNRLRCGAGDYLDFARYDAVVTVLDPVFGAQGQVAAARRGPSRWRGRPRNQDAYPIYPCRDGHVRLCVMAPRQWRGLRAWLGEPAEFTDPRFDVIGERFAVWPQISALVEKLFAGATMADLVAAGQAHGVPIAAVLDPAQVLTGEHFTAAGAAVDAVLAPGVTARVPVGYWVVDGEHTGFTDPAPTIGGSDVRWRADTAVPAPAAAVGARPFDGLRILDLGIIVAGGEATRLFADLGAEVIKVESSAYPDGLRQTRAGSVMSESFAWTHRNSLAFGLDLRSPAGQEVFDRLLGTADAVFANFKPGTLAALGFSYDTLHRVNPGLVLAESSAFGEVGPWSARLGYGPLVRATTGVTRLWTAPEPAADAARHPFYDATTVFPDHVVGRVTAIGALAALIHRERTGSGVRVHVSQAETAVNQLATRYVVEAAGAAGAAVEAGTVVHAVCACAGDDEWCVISIRDDNDWRSTATTFDDPALADDTRFATGAARVAHRTELAAALSRHTGIRTPGRIAELLQAAGVPTGQMNRPPDIAEDPQLLHRNVFDDMIHPLIEHPLPAETGPVPFRNIPAAPQRPAPRAGQDTRAVCRTVLGMDPEQTERLIADGVLFAADGSGRLDEGEAALEPSHEPDD